MMNDPNRQIMMTTTDELFLPSRIIYRVFDRAKVLAIFQKLHCMGSESSERWTWNYAHEARKMDFPPAYDQVPRDCQPLLLASCHWVAPDCLHVYVRTTLRLRKFLEFFTRIPRRYAEAEFFDEYNLLTTVSPGQPVPRPEDFFLDESKIILGDFDDLASGLTAEAQLLRISEQTLQPLERHRLTAFYIDGPDHMLHAMTLRELLALEQYRSAEPVRPFAVLRRMLERSGEAAKSDSASDTAFAVGDAAKKPSHDVATEREQSASAVIETNTFSFVKHDPMFDRDLVEISLPSGTRERFVPLIGCCENPCCECQVLDLWLGSLDDPQRHDLTHHLRLDTETRQVQCGTPDEPFAQTIAQALEARFTPADWDLADRWYRSGKADQSEPTDARKITAHFPEETLNDPSEMVEYQEVFTYARYTRFENAGKLWFVREHYCTNPTCDCKQVCLGLVPMPGEYSGEVAIDYDHGTGTVRLRETTLADAPPFSELMTALKAADPDLKSRLQRRQRVLRQLHRKARRERRPVAQAVPAVPKVGRNDPCPCGSGKKFKKCCALNAVDQS